MTLAVTKIKVQYEKNDLADWHAIEWYPLQDIDQYISHILGDVYSSDIAYMIIEYLMWRI